MKPNQAPDTPARMTVFETIHENPYSVLGRPATTGYDEVASTVFEGVGTTPTDGEPTLGGTGTAPDPFPPEPEPLPEPLPQPLPPHP